MSEAHHWGADLTELLVETIPVLVRAIKSVPDFFLGSGVPREILQVHYDQIKLDKSQTNKYHIARDVVLKVNGLGERGLQCRREIIKRVVEFETFEQCWPNEQAKARGLVAQVREMVGRKDSFTQMNQERKAAERERRTVREEQLKALQERRAKLVTLRDRFAALYGSNDPHGRGKAFEGLLNDLFTEHGIGVREAFEIRSEGGVCLEQIDGVVEVNAGLFLVEAKWWESPVGKPELSNFGYSVITRGGVGGGIFISGNGFSRSAVEVIKPALVTKPVILISLNELWGVIDEMGDLVEFLRERIDAAVIDKNPYIGKILSDC